MQKGSIGEIQIKGVQINPNVSAKIAKMMYQHQLQLEKDKIMLEKQKEEFRRRREEWNNNNNNMIQFKVPIFHTYHYFSVF